MQFEYQVNIRNNSIPCLVIPVSEILKAKNYKTNEKANEERALLNRCLAIYTAYCGTSVIIPSQAFSSFCEQIGKNGKVFFSFEQAEEGLYFSCRVISNEGERAIDCPFMETVR